MNKILKTIKLVQAQIKDFEEPIVTKVSYKRDPYLVLISCILSLRTQDRTTSQASKRLFEVTDNPHGMVKLSVRQIQKLIYPVGFYRNKSKAILGISKKIIEDYNGKVPDDLEALLEFKGVGRKTANLVLGLGFGIPALCVDTHVHRISNRLGWVKTQDPEQTEQELRKIVPKDYWIDLNTLFVTFGQNICLPLSPFCSICKVFSFCKRVGVNKSR